MLPERFERLRAVLDRRQPDLTVLMDNVHKPHNFSAVLRTCDAVGVFQAHAVWPSPRLRPAHDTAGGSGKWVPVRTHRSIADAVGVLEAGGFTVVAAHPARDAVDFREIDYTRPTAVLLGAELEGVGDEGLELAHRHVVVPMHGHVRSLNVSVAAAVILFEAERQRTAAGLYASTRLAPEIHARTLFEWAHPHVAAWCRRHAKPYPALGEDGTILGEVGRIDPGAAR
jgi:tRNA (guanosine-2'-O-)-methyltransferase